MAQERGAGRAKPAAEVPEEYRAIFEAVTDGLLITDLATGRIVEVNPAVCRMHGYRRDELVGSLTTTVIHPGDHPLFTDFADAIQGLSRFLVSNCCEARRSYRSPRSLWGLTS